MKNYKGEELIYTGCPACAYARKEFSLPCGMAYEDENFSISQDWELPIEGFFVVATKSHTKTLSEFSDDMRNELFSIVNKTINILRDNKVCDDFDVIFEDRNDSHFHVWIMPRLPWMKELVNESITSNLKLIFEYAKNNFRNEEVYERIDKICKMLKEKW